MLPDLDWDLVHLENLPRRIRTDFWSRWCYTFGRQVVLFYASWAFPPRTHNSFHGFPVSQWSARPTYSFFFFAYICHHLSSLSLCLSPGKKRIRVCCTSLDGRHSFNCNNYIDWLAARTHYGLGKYFFN